MAWFGIYIAAGAFVGILAGLLGIGGGMTLVPVLAAIFTLQGYAPDHIVHLALGTAMASIVFTSASSVREHWRLGGVDLSIVKRMAPGMVTGSRAGTCSLTHSSSVCGTQPILGAIDSTAAQRDGYSPLCSCTIRTARSRTSGENLFDFFMAQSSQRMEPPQNPGRFIEPHS